MSEDDEDGGESLLGPYSARLPCLPPRGVRGGGPSPGAVPTGARGPRTSGVPGLPVCSLHAFVTSNRQQILSPAIDVPHAGINGLPQVML